MDQSLKKSENNPLQKRLIDGSHPLDCSQLLSMLDAGGIAHKTVTHAPMFTVEDAKSLRAPCDYGHTKNLFVRNKKGRMWLLTLHEDRKVDLKTTAQLVGANRFSFASPERLMQYLGVTQGAVSAFSILNDVTHQVQFYIDEALMEAPALHIHPLINTRTTSIDREALLEFLGKHGFQHRILRFGMAI
jgi:Ala-tRNA(Pro) deacylase